jgi:hypothetical protein
MDLVSINDGASFLGDVYDFTFAGIERHHSLSPTRKAQGAVLSIIKGQTIFLIVDKEANFYRYFLKWCIYNNSNANQAGISF